MLDSLLPTLKPRQLEAIKHTFSKEDARNMREKVEKLLQGKEVIIVKTFHSILAVFSIGLLLLPGALLLIIGSALKTMKKNA